MTGTSHRNAYDGLVVCCCLLLKFWCSTVVGVVDYGDALSKSILFFEAQRSGPLPSSQRIIWRGDSGLFDGSDANVDLVGGYYDAGDNVKYLFPMAFTITMLSWGTIEYGNYMGDAGELDNVLDALRWGCDFFIKANTGPTELWVQVGDPQADHHCWERPEDMDTPRKLYKIDETNPGSEVAAETSAALAASSIVFSTSDPPYANILLQRAIALFEFANGYQGSQKATCPFYCSYNGYNDELLWAAAWLFKATNASLYLDYILANMENSISVTEFSWDNKYAGVQILLSSIYLSGEYSLEKFKAQADAFFCSVLPYSPSRRVPTTPGGLLFFRNGANTQYATSIAFLAAVYADRLEAAGELCGCSQLSFAPETLVAFATTQANYILGENPLGISYMVGYGDLYPVEAHHRGSSLPSIFDDPEAVPCITGAVVGGPDEWDGFLDWRPNSFQLEPTTYINAPFVGLLARMYSLYMS